MDCQLVLFLVRFAKVARSSIFFAPEGQYVNRIKRNGKGALRRCAILRVYYVLFRSSGAQDTFLDFSTITILLLRSSYIHLTKELFRMTAHLYEKSLFRRE